MTPEQQAAAVEITKTQPEGEVYDVMGGSGRWEVKVHEHGLVALVDIMPRFAPVRKLLPAICSPLLRRGVFDLLQQVLLPLRRGKKVLNFLGWYIR
jgi:hypothetical protein